MTLLRGCNKQADMERSAQLAKSVQQEFSDVFSGIGSFKCTFSLQVKDGIKPYQVSLRYVACALQEPLKKVEDRLW